MTRMQSLTNCAANGYLPKGYAKPSSEYEWSYDSSYDVKPKKRKKKRVKVSVERDVFTIDEKLTISKMYKEDGLSYVKIAKKLGLEAPKVQSYLAKSGAW